MTAELEVVRRQKIVLVHDLSQVGGADLAHAALLVVERDDLAVKPQAGLLQGGEIGRIVRHGVEAGVSHDEGLDLLVSQHGAQPAAPGLLEPGDLPTLIVEREIEAAQVGVFGPLAGGHGGDVLSVLLVAGEHVHHLLGQKVAVHFLVRGFENADPSFVAVDEDDDVLLRLALHLQGVEAGELEVRTEIATDVAVDRNARHG